MRKRRQKEHPKRNKWWLLFRLSALRHLAHCTLLKFADFSAVCRLHCHRFLHNFFVFYTVYSRLGCSWLMKRSTAKGHRKCTGRERERAHVRERLRVRRRLIERDGEWEQGKGRKERGWVFDVCVCVWCVSAANVFHPLLLLLLFLLWLLPLFSWISALLFFLVLAFRSCSMLIFTIHCYIHNIFHYFSYSARSAFHLPLHCFPFITQRKSL